MDGEAGEVAGLRGLPGDGLEKGTELLLVAHCGEIHLRHEKDSSGRLIRGDFEGAWRLIGGSAAQPCAEANKALPGQLPC